MLRHALSDRARPVPSPGLALCASILVLGGCNSDGSISLFGNNQTPASASSTTAAAKELTATEGKKLLKEIREDPKRMKTLTVQEKRFLAGVMPKDDPLDE